MNKNTINLLEFQDKFLDRLKDRGKSFNTIKNYKTDLNCFNQYYLKRSKTLHMTFISSSEVQEYGVFLQNKYPSTNSIRRRVQALRIFFDYLVEEQFFSENPIRKMPVAAKVVSLPMPTIFPEIYQLISHLKDQYKNKNNTNLEKLIILRNMLIIIFIYESGLKVSDLEILKTGSILLSKENKQRVLIQHPKRDPISITLPSYFKAFYEYYLSELQKQSENNSSAILFNANPYQILSGGISSRGVEVIFKELSTKLKVKITPKTLRQAAIFKWLNQKIPESTIKDWMGVTPQYSLAPYQELFTHNPTQYSYQELTIEQFGIFEK